MWKIQQPCATEAKIGATGYLKAAGLRIFDPVLRALKPEVDPGTSPRPPGPAPHISSHQKSAPETSSEATS